MSIDVVRHNGSDNSFSLVKVCGFSSKTVVSYTMDPCVAKSLVCSFNEFR